MSRHALLEQLRPSSIVDAVTDGGLAEFLELYAETQLLVVRVPAGDEGVPAGLETTVPRDGSGKLAKPQLAAMSFQTAVVSDILGTTETAQQTGNFNERALVDRLSQAEHFVTPLQKREDKETAYAERVSVGRAGNRDLVLRHASVSKFHGWFERDELSTYYVADAGSKNGTRVNGVAIAARQTMRVSAGDWIRFGSIETMLCAPEMFYNALSTL